MYSVRVGWFNTTKTLPRRRVRLRLCTLTRSTSGEYMTTREALERSRSFRLPTCACRPRSWRQPLDFSTNRDPALAPDPLPARSCVPGRKALVRRCYAVWRRPHSHEDHVHFAKLPRAVCNQSRCSHLLVILGHPASELSDGRTLLLGMMNRPAPPVKCFRCTLTVILGPFNRITECCTLRSRCSPSCFEFLHTDGASSSESAALPSVRTCSMR